MGALNMKFFTTGFVGVVVAIVTTGAILKAAGDGKLGSTAQTLAKTVTAGYGAGA